MNTRLSLLFAAALGAYSGQILAVTPTATAKVSGLTFTLQDLDLGDGISPSLTFDHVAGRGTNWSTGVYIWDGTSTTLENTGRSADPSQDSVQYMTPGEWHTNIAGQVASASSTADTLTATVRAHLAEEPLPPGQSRNLALTAYSFPGNFSSHQFTLSANTAMSVSGQYTLTALVTPSHIHNFALAHFHFAIQGGDLGQNYQEVSDLLSSASGGPPSATRSASFNLSFSNPTSQQIVGDISGFVGAQALIDTTIPEPESTALMLSGLIVAGIMGHRRRMRQTTHQARTPKP